MVLKFVILLLATLCGSVSATPSLSVSISAPPSVASIDNLTITATITNTGKRSLKLLNHPRTVLSHLSTRIFNIRRENDIPEFTGMVVYYSPDYVIRRNNSVDFTFLAPGQSLERVHSLAGVYNFTSIGPGEFEIKVDNRFYHVDPLGNLLSFEADTHPARFELTGGLARSHKIAPKNISPFKGPVQTLQIQCTVDQQNMIIEAATYADRYISNALTYLQTINGNTPRYVAWFGAYDPQRAEAVKFHYANSLGRAMLSTYDCMPDSCKDGSVAYVWRQQPGVIHFCSWFWPRPAYGSNSKAGTIIHELTHFTGTEDYAYGEIENLELARSSPASAVMNADSHMYFAENYPPLQ
ncbi:unnamed protein product [Rhizoctonia solani]|uniref:Lysine-specific metallo-endopeptidase domain-containing protein n=1 Tax=Rhizoctonia solani TaxID=456999 RepID=A0A8H3H7F3_9AGAM|nr:unnamed protein product [Rhizoctonia solani]